MYLVQQQGVSPVLQQQVHHLDAPLLDRGVQRRGAGVGVAVSRAATFLQKQLQQFHLFGCEYGTMKEQRS